ncbi:hypothetical protein A2130_03705 [Candidatus Woesebacteria bacterium GWC2_33_12]|nr:MAG: hypothetical protein A2130_03705 [Candidatus Woesebacteria bacterium GWC2_33_12]OGM79393.1 MAG: hypothetical protein A2366_00175 [Candidatus Woesebacteria bacterium RIFOXYB1_FULL_33_9]OGM85223.1 MAG: hypothetical protein A2616_04500 [Candidatus Woesebacteria bacterium RIFOXYD1_FULL_33_11]
MKKRKLLSNVIFPTAIFLISLLFRSYNLTSTEIYPDEITWTVRSREAFLAIKTNNFDYFKSAWWTKDTDTEAINLPQTIISGASIFLLAKGQPTHYSLELFSDFIAARIPIVFLTSIFIAIFYFITKRITNNKYIALLASLLLSIDPTSIALSRWLLVDYPLTIWMFLAISSFFLIKNIKISIIVSSIFISLAFLTKPTGLILFIPLFLSKQYKTIITFFCFLVFAKLLWLGQEGNIIIDMYSYIFNQFQLSNNSFITFFNGKITSNPPFYYYVQQILTRLPIIIISSLLFYPIFVKKKILKNKKLLTIIIPLFVISYILILSIPAKKLGIRYIFPVIPWLYLFSGISIYYFLNKLHKFYKTIAIISIFAISSTVSLFYFPNYYIYRNIFSGGPKIVQSNEVIGLCMGARSSILNLINKYPDIKSVAYLGCSKSTLPYYTNVTISTDWKTERFVIVEESMKLLSPNLEEIIYFNNKKPIYINDWHGVVLSRIYDNLELEK